MATQGEIRQRAVSAVRALRRLYRAADSAGEKVERELDRLIKRKTLISIQSLQTLGRLQLDYQLKANDVARGMEDLYGVVQGTMQL